ncbi:S9 family peptidase [Aquicoccus porphyridii]|uniref:S9 family peptidase n=1 Tax=Aquicoccus porphyridii TaxID=1852029 RepID=A0A5A9ZKB1_9RHOB|nr:prolyl oligopeptidase family serine peptidase [Aquicoccus porphyridii]KAA0917754.1 S9 family peptidase [Aquicoccus porphyridii]RAI55826.1 hypothetical protein DOO74_05480 [Rhodobacteraceae bacterium AsT-22]
MKKIAFICLLLVLGGVAFVFALTKNTPASHPVLRASDLPTLIPTRAFYANPRSEFGYVASHDGVYTISEKASLFGRSMVVREIASGEQIAEFPIGLSGIRWHPDKPLLRFIFEGHDWEADPFNPERENWRRTSPVKLSGGWNLTQYATNAEEPVLFWGRTSRSELGHMWRVSQDGLDVERMAEGNSRSHYWVFNKGKTKPILRVDSLNTSTQRVFRKTESTWDVLFDLDLNDVFEPLSPVDETGHLVARSSRGRDKAALVRLDTTTGEETVLVENPDGDIGAATALTYDEGPDIIRMGLDTLDRVALTDRGEVFLNILAEFPQPVSLGYTSATPSGRYVIQAISPQSKSWIYLLIDLENQSYEVLDEFHFRRFQDRLVQEKSVRFQARDGLQIPAVLSMPRGVSGPIPFIVHIHGGPAGASALGYDHDTQFLVNRGYGVLSVNFRGSKGFGKAFQAKGFGRFGRAMQDDIADAAQWLVEEGLADTDALVAMGTSYGGYSAALAMTRDPGLFDAAVVEFPMLDVEFQSKYHPGFWNNGIDGWWRYFGQLDDPDDLALMRDYSPANRIDDIHGPILIHGGLRDQIAAVQQVRDFEAAALAAGKDVTVRYFPNAGHGTQHWRDNLDRARSIEDFLANHAGGRSGGFEFVEWAPGVID